MILEQDPDPHTGAEVEGVHQNSMILEHGSRSKPSCLFPGPIVRGQLSRQLSRHCSLPGSSWLSLPIPEPSEPEQSPKKPMSSSEPILDLKGDTAEALPENLAAAEEQSSCPPGDTPGSGQSPEPTEPRPAARDSPVPEQVPGPAGDGSGSAAGTPGPAQPGPGTAARPEERDPRDPSPTESPPWPEAPEEPPARPNTLDFSKSLRRPEEGQPRRGSDRVKENGVEATPATAAASDERRELQSELGKCIEEFRRIRIPAAFPNKKRQWQSELLKKYQL
ncbi:SCAN domain-containing protein 1 [Prinia subflava]|uniref:SCAN domain-containing protein 1 n=1 Tax=Prinia subflava TaxID=208062 RepID=UPI002FE099B0